MVEFTDDDAGYLAWLKENQGGFVLNRRRGADPNYLTLHRATCRTISRTDRKPGAYTCRNYRKVCATTIAELQIDGMPQLRRDNDYFKRCGFCDPT